MQNEISFFTRCNYLLPLIQTRGDHRAGLSVLTFLKCTSSYSFCGWEIEISPEEICHFQKIPLQEMMHQKKHFSTFNTAVPPE